MRHDLCVASLRTEITEIVTGLGMLGLDGPGEALDPGDPPPQYAGVGNEHWARLRGAWGERTHEGEFHAAFNNGRAFLHATDGLRRRTPAVLEWKGGHRDPADDAVPADLRIDHVYLVSCKYASRVLHNASPWALFDRCLAGAPARGGGDWFAEVAPAEHQAHYQAVRRLMDHGDRLPERVGDLDRVQRRGLAGARDRTSAETATAYAELASTVSRRSAARWAGHLSSPAERRSMLWRLLRLSATPYFVLGTGRRESLRLRVATPWDWHQRWVLDDFEIVAEPAGQPRIAWAAVVTCREERMHGQDARLDAMQGAAPDAVRDAAGGDRAGGPQPGQTVEVKGHVEVRWSHGRLGGSPEAKVYLDTPHREVPGYIELR